MDNEKNLEFEGAVKEADFSSESSSRARNRTVMLTPEITGQVRARLAQDLGPGFNQPFANKAPGAFEAPQAAPAGTYSPAASGGGTRGGYEPADAFAPPPRHAAPPPVQQSTGIKWDKESPVVGFLVTYDSNPNGDFYVLRSGRVMITSQSTDSGNCLYVNDDTVSPMHAIMRISPKGEIQVLDQLSEHGTRIKRFGSTEEETLSGDKGSVEHGDVILFGNCKFHVCIIVKSEETKAE